MVNDLKDLMRANVAAPPPDHLDVDALVGAGRRRVRGRRALVSGGAALLVAGVVAGTAVTWPTASRHDDAAGHPKPSGPVLHLSDAKQAVEGRDYQVLASYTNDNLDADNGQYFDGVTDDGLVLFRDGPRLDQEQPRFALMDPATSAKDWLPDLNIGQNQTWPVALGTHQLVLASGTYDDDAGLKTNLVAYVFDRDTRQWSTQQWPKLPELGSPGGVIGSDGRLYVRVPATQGSAPAGAADDSGAVGDTYHLWSVSLTDGADVRDEGLTVGDVAFTDSSMVWTDSTNGAGGRVHVRDLSTGDEHSFDPQAGAKCNLLSFGASGDRVVMGEYCGNYAGPGDDPSADAGTLRDDRVQILSTDGDQIATIQDNDLEGGLVSTGGTDGVVTIGAYTPGRGGTYVYDLGTDRFLRISDAMAKWGMGGPAPDGQFIWNTPVNNGAGATTLLGELLPH